ncbi:MAG: hypothetical protein IPO33_18100 [Saprospiraceae bacterium]|nr:hypothetical protein [Candidatus Brachybacter algidus]
MTDAISVKDFSAQGSMSFAPSSLVDLKSDGFVMTGGVDDEVATLVSGFTVSGLPLLIMTGAVGLSFSGIVDFLLSSALTLGLALFSAIGFLSTILTSGVEGDVTFSVSDTGVCAGAVVSGTETGSF